MELNIVSVTARLMASSGTKYLRMTSDQHQTVSVFFDSASFALFRNAGYGDLANLPVNGTINFPTPILVGVEKRSNYYSVAVVHTKATAEPLASAPAAVVPPANYEKVVHASVTKLCYLIANTPGLTAFGMDTRGWDIIRVSVCQLTAFGTLRINFNDSPVSNWDLVSSFVGRRTWLVWDETQDDLLEHFAARMGVAPVYPTSVTRLMPIFARYIGKAGATIPQYLAFAAFGIDDKAILSGFAERDKRDLPPFTPALTRTLSQLLLLKAMAANATFNALALMEPDNA